MTNTYGIIFFVVGFEWVQNREKLESERNGVKKVGKYFVFKIT